jgi:hypothetical protein
MHITAITTITTAAVSIAALALGIYNCWQGRLKDKRDLRHRVEQDKRNKFLWAHEWLMAPDSQRGRHILAQVRSPEDAKRLLLQQPEDYQVVHRAISMLDFAANRVRRGEIDEPSFVEQWGSSYSSLREPVAILATERKECGLNYNDWRWPDFQALANDLCSNDVVAPVPVAPPTHC